MTLDTQSLKNLAAAIGGKLPADALEAAAMDNSRKIHAEGDDHLATMRQLREKNNE